MRKHRVSPASASQRRVVARYTSSGRLTPMGPDPRIALPLGSMDPFLLIDHHGPSGYAPGSVAPKLGAHPHRGFETVTFIVQGALRHQDSTGLESVVQAGGVQWMTAGSGLYHDESLPAEFMASGGTSEVIQLWLNLPPALKMVAPRYQAAQATDLVHVATESDGVDLAVVAGVQGDRCGPLEPVTGAMVSVVTAASGAWISLPVPDDRTALLYVVSGRITADGVASGARTLLDYSSGSGSIDVVADEDASLVFCHAAPIDAPIAAEGPFVMNTREQIEQAFDDFGSGRVSKGVLS